MPEIGNSLLLNYSYYSDNFDSAVHARQCLMFESDHLAIALLDNKNVLAFEQFLFKNWNDELFDQSRIAALKQSLPALVLFRTDAALFLPEEFRKNRFEPIHILLPLKDGFEMAEHKPAAFPAVVSFAIPKNMLVSLRNHFPGAVLLHHSLPVFIWMMNHKKLMESSILIESRNERLYVYAVKDKRPLLFNSFEVNSPEDAAYYTLMVMEQLNMDPVKQTVYYKTASGSENLFSVCRRFIPSLVSAEMLNPLHKPEQELLFPFLLYASLCE